MSSALSITIPDLTMVSPGPLQKTAFALQQRLRLVFPERRFVHAWMPPRVGKEDWKRLLRRMLFVGLGWADADPIKNAPRSFTGESGWTVFLVTRNTAGARELYLGDAQGPGLFDMVHAGVAILHGHTISGVGTVSVVKTGNAFAENWDGDDTAMAAIDLKVGLTFDLADVVSGVPETILTTIGINWSWTSSLGGVPQVEQSDTISTGATL